MKKIILFFTLILTLVTQATAQHNLGVRIGGFGGYDIEVSWQTTIGNSNIEIDFGPANHRDRDYVGFIGIYQWHWELGNDFSWYAGFGPVMRIYTDHDTEHNPLGLGGAGQVGIAYKFPIPLQISLDLRPSFDLFNLKAFYWSAALSARYRF